MAEATGFINEIDCLDPRKQCCICESRHKDHVNYPCNMCLKPHKVNNESIDYSLENFSEDDFNGTCAWCGEDFDQSLLTRTDLGYLCEHCIEAIRSRGESVTIYMEDRL